MKAFDFRRAAIRIHNAQQAMNAAPTIETTGYWVRIWRARRRIYRIAQAKRLASEAQLMP